MSHKSPGTVAMSEVRRFKDNVVQLTNGGQYSQYDTINRIIKYTRSEFLNDNGSDAIFRNISNQRIPLYAKSIDMDSKDFYVFGVGKTNWYQAWVLNVRFKKWTRETRFALTLDETSTGIATFGSSVWKKYTDKSGEVKLMEANLRNLYFDPTVKNIIDSPVVELHYLNETQIRSMYPKQAEEILKYAKKGRDDDDNESETDDPKYIIWERCGEFINEQYGVEYKWMIGAGEGDKEVHMVDNVLKMDKRNQPKDFKYFDFHGERVKGRWLSLGVVERLFHLQEEMNTIVNQNAEASNIASLLLFRTEDPNIAGNILQQAQSGQILNSPDLQQLSLDNRFINEYLNQVKRINQDADALCYIQETISGETPPSGVPFRSMAMASRGAVSTFDYIKTHIGEKMGIVILEELMPDLIKGFNREDAVEISEDELDIAAFDESMVHKAINKNRKTKAKAGMVIFEEDEAALAQKIMEDVRRNRRMEEHGKKFFDFEYGITMNPTGESIDKEAKNSALDGILAAMAATPALVDTVPFKHKVSLNGLPPFRLTPVQQQQMQERSGGKPLPEAPQDKLSDLAAI